MHSYDLTEDNRGLELTGRLVNTDLVLARNTAYIRWQHAKKMGYDGSLEAYRSMYYVLDALLDNTVTGDMLTR